MSQSTSGAATAEESTGEHGAWEGRSHSKRSRRWRTAQRKCCIVTVPFHKKDVSVNASLETKVAGRSNPETNPHSTKMV